MEIKGNKEDNLEIWSLTKGQLWEQFIGQPLDGFMGRNEREDIELTLEEALEDYEISEEDKEYILKQLKEYILEHAEEWAKEHTEYFAIDFQEVLERGIPLTSEFDDSWKKADFRAVKKTFYDYREPPQEISERWDLECFNALHWESILLWPEENSDDIKNIIKYNSKVFSVRINKREDNIGTQKKISALYQKVREYKEKATLEDMKKNFQWMHYGSGIYFIADNSRDREKIVSLLETLQDPDRVNGLLVRNRKYNSRKKGTLTLKAYREYFSGMIAYCDLSSPVIEFED
jgi:hypothetical protein